MWIKQYRISELGEPRPFRREKMRGLMRRGEGGRGGGVARWAETETLRSRDRKGEIETDAES